MIYLFCYLVGFVITAVIVKFTNASDWFISCEENVYFNKEYSFGVTLLLFIIYPITWFALGVDRLSELGWGEKVGKWFENE